MRRSGRTFRMLLKAMLKASEGNHVIVLVADYKQLRCVVDKLRRMMYDINHHVTNVSHAPQIKFTHAPNSSITVVQGDVVERKVASYTRLYGNEPHVFTDHWVFDKELFEFEKRRGK